MPAQSQQLSKEFFKFAFDSSIDQSLHFTRTEGASLQQFPQDVGASVNAIGGPASLLAGEKEFEVSPEQQKRMSECLLEPDDDPASLSDAMRSAVSANDAFGFEDAIKSLSNKAGDESEDDDSEPLKKSFERPRLVPGSPLPQPKIEEVSDLKAFAIFNEYKTMNV